VIVFVCPCKQIWLPCTRNLVWLPPNLLLSLLTVNSSSARRVKRRRSRQQRSGAAASRVRAPARSAGLAATSSFPEQRLHHPIRARTTVESRRRRRGGAGLGATGGRRARWRGARHVETTRVFRLVDVRDVAGSSAAKLGRERRKTKHGRFVAMGRRRGAEVEGDGGNHISPRKRSNAPGCEKQI